MNHRASESGKIVLAGVAVTLLVSVIAALVVFVVPVQAKAAELEEYMGEQADRAGYTEAEELLHNIVKKAQELELPVEEDNIQIRESRDRIRIRARYAIPIGLAGFTYPLRMVQEVERPVFRL